MVVQARDLERGVGGISPIQPGVGQQHFSQDDERKAIVMDPAVKAGPLPEATTFADFAGEKALAGMQQVGEARKILPPVDPADLKVAIEGVNKGLEAEQIIEGISPSKEGMRLRVMDEVANKLEGALENETTALKVADAAVQARPKSFAREQELDEAQGASNVQMRAANTCLKLADSCQQQIGDLNKEMEERLNAVRDLHRLKQLFQERKEEMGADDTMDLTNPQTEAEREMARLCETAKEHGVLIGDLSKVTTKDLDRYNSALGVVSGNLTDINSRKMLWVQRIMNAWKAFMELGALMIERLAQLINMILQSIRSSAR